MKYHNVDGINVLLEKTPKTPRIAVNFFFKTDKKEKFFGVNALLARLLLQGTKKYSAVELSKEFEEECIDITFKAKQDYIKASLIFLNEDFKKAMVLFKELMLNSTFDDFEKEIIKIKGEIISDLDNPKMKLTDALIRNMYPIHPYGSVHTRILEDIDKISKNDIISAHQDILNSQKAVSIVGDINQNDVLEYLKSEYSFMATSQSKDEVEDIFELNEDKNIWLTKNDASQAQIIQGWIIESFKSDKCAKYAVLNNILGSSGLSSRLFVNLRDKQGLAYTVRSQYETLLHSGIFNMYIGTAPTNIEKSLKGFEDELRKLAQTPPDEIELQGAKENLSGRMKYFTQNNAQIASVYGYNYIMGLGLDYNEEFIAEINKVEAKSVSEMAQKLLEAHKVTAIIAPEVYKPNNF